ncbi:uncharacterized protein LOC125659557 [Ostrea edulis]|uniref:uncharacterized protein LOC125659557 n=1 Tax=Ostrea edulis TaxID=37623 RepID=UPI0024AF618C|nr:uncharacterized protein LOC125659557 [Ostrea edulis]
MLPATSRIKMGKLLLVLTLLVCLVALSSGIPSGGCHYGHKRCHDSKPCCNGYECDYKYGHWGCCERIIWWRPGVIGENPDTMYNGKRPPTFQNVWWYWWLILRQWRQIIGK